VPRLGRREGSGVVKICGLTRAEDACGAASAGADFLGFVFFPGSRRCLDLAATAWIATLPPGPGRVGVFRNQDAGFVEEVAARAGLRLVQLHGDEPPEVCAALGGRGRVVKAVSISGPVDWGRVRAWGEVAQVLFDTASPTGGGTGRSFDWRLVAARPARWPVWLAGGLDPHNVGAAIATVRPTGVDVASGVEAAVGRKDLAKMRAFVAAARAAWAAMGGPGEGEEDEATAR